MIRKILLILIPLLILSGATLWWLGNRALEEREREAERARQEAIEAEQVRQELLELNIQAVSSTTLDVAARAIKNKAGKPLQTLDQAEISKIAYTYADLVLVSDTGPSRHAYQLSIQQTLETYSRGLTTDENQALLRYFDTGEPKALDPVVTSHQNLERTVGALLKTNVPMAYSLLHLQLINRLASLREIIYNMSQAEREPLLASESANLRTQKYQDLYLAIAALDRALQRPITP